MAKKTNKNQQKANQLRAHLEHPRQFLGSQLVYPVLSRRSGGISIGVNLNPKKKMQLQLSVLPGQPRRQHQAC